MAKKQSTKQRTQIKELPKKEEKLGPGRMKKVKGGAAYMKYDGIIAPPKPTTIK